ncbi:MAG: hypothetical protein LBB86_03065 [Oscillospiraceae bacterium]|jgi:RNA-binding protein YlmH|nr:hypothetical protein [Oscillospiraceae bacterium]
MDNGHREAVDSVERRLAELAKRADSRGEAVFTRFLDPAQQSKAARIAREAGVAVEFWGGYDNAERRIGALFPRGYIDEGASATLDWPIACVRAAWAAAYGSPAHRDLLGASLAIVQDRARFGDVVMGGGYALLFCLSELADYVVMTLTSAGRAALKCSIEPDPSSAIPDQAEPRRELRDTIPSFRLDACVASAFRISRAQAQGIIHEGKVRLNHLPELKPDAQVDEGGVVSVRGLGRAVLKEKLGVNRKGRFCVLWLCTTR